MQRLDYSTRERISTQAGAMDLNAGRLVISEAVKAFILSSSAAGLSAAGLAVAGLAAGGLWSDWGWLRVLAGATVAAGLAVAGLAGGLAGTLAHILVSGWYRWRARLEDWHRAELAAYAAAGGQRVDREMTIRALTIQEPTHALLVALALAERARRGELQEPSVAAMVGDIWLGRVKVGELTKAQAEEFGQALHQVGFIRGRKKGYAGKLATTDPGEIIELVTHRAGRIRQLAPAAVGEVAGEGE